MAVRENQWLQIALIIFVMTTIVFFVTTYLFFDYYRKERLKTETAQTERAEADKKFNELDEKKTQLLGLFGKKPEDFNTYNKELHDKFMAEFNAALDKNASFLGLDKNIRDDADRVAKLNVLRIFDAMHKAVDERSKEVAAATTKLATATKTYADAEAKLKAENVAFKAEAEKQKAAYDTAMATFKQDVAGMEKTKTEITGRVESLAQQLNESTDKIAGLNKAKENDKRQAEKVIGEQKVVITSLTDPTPSLTDGLIVSVNERSSSVYVNIGRADGAARRISFSVYGRGTGDKATAVKKGSVEIIDVIDDKISLARIKENSEADPILPGDYIDSPLWHPGKKQKFAIVGYIDFDNDSLSDRQLLKDLINSNGGEIVAEVNERGEATGRITSDTVFLIEGKQIDEKSGQNQKLVAETTKIKNDAAKFQVAIMPLPKFLDSIGFVKTPTYDISSGGTRLVPTVKPSINDQFRPRAPSVPAPQ